MSAIRRFAHHVAEKFRPDKIILFGSHAYGTPHADSDVDILVVMPARSLHGQAVKIRAAVPRPFAMDQIVRTGKVSRAFLGVAIQEISPDIAAAFKFNSLQGALISDVDPSAVTRP